MGLAQFLVTQTGIDVVNGKNDVKKVWKSPFFQNEAIFSEISTKYAIDIQNISP